jgi:MYXO-CTERM domain-containing protein
MIHLSCICRAAGLAAALLATSEAFACRTTTCAAPNAPPECVRDAATHCWRAGAPLAWEQGCVSFSVQAEGVPSLALDYGATEALVVQAFALWPTADCGGSFPSISVASMGPLLCSEPEYNPRGPNSNAVVFRETDWPHDLTAIGLTTVSFDTETGKIFDADIEVNLSGFLLSHQDVSYVVAHEAGHFLGMDHSADANALMYEQYSPFGNSMPPALLPDDVATICSTYPASRAATACDFEPERGLSNECGGDVVGGCNVAAPRTPSAFWTLGASLLGVAALGRRRRQRRCAAASSR